ncbi:MAG: hypothetical protein U0X75_19225 [Acidobacteriota bacterium]
MSNNIFDQLRDAARRKAQELDEKFGLKDKLEQGVSTASQVANDVVGKAGETLNQAATTAREQFDKFDHEYSVTDNLRDTAAKAEDTIRQGAQTAQANAAEFSQTAEEKAREIFGSAQGYYRRAEQAYNTGASGARIVDATLSGYDKARAWVKENPGKTAIVSLSLVAGVRLQDLGLTILGAGAGGNWFFHSALPIVGMRKLTEKYNDYLKEQEALLAQGKLDEAERGKLEFQRNLTKYVGAPLLGAFSVAAGATMIGAAFSGATVTGLPLSLILGGNPLLNGIWFFANGVVCISEGYKFFMIALADQQDVERVVREIKGLLPA